MFDNALLASCEAITGRPPQRMRARMTMDVFLFVRLVAELRVLVPSGVQIEEIAFPHFCAVFYHLGRVEVELVHRVRQVHDDARAAEPLNGNLVDRPAVSHEVTRRIEVRPHVIRRHDVLRVDAMLGLALDVLHFERRIVRPEGKLFVQRLGEIVNFHMNSSGRPEGRHYDCWPLGQR
jgi:hypothetical protein